MKPIDIDDRYLGVVHVHIHVCTKPWLPTTSMCSPCMQLVQSSTLQVTWHCRFYMILCMCSSIITVVSRVSTHGRLIITHNFGPHGCLPGIKIAYICIETATVAPWNAVHGRLPRCGRLPGTLRLRYIYAMIVTRINDTYTVDKAFTSYQCLFIGSMY